MCLPAEAASIALWEATRLGLIDFPFWLYYTVSELLRAALLLYGTRLLRAEERAGGSGEADETFKKAQKAKAKGHEQADLL